MENSIKLYSTTCTAGRRHTSCSLVGFSQPKPTSQQCFSLTTNQHQLAQTSLETNQRVRCIDCWVLGYRPLPATPRTKSIGATSKCGSSKMN